MSEIVTRDTQSLSLNPATVMSTPGAGTVKLAEWAMELNAAHQLGTALCATDFVPADFRGKPEAAAAAILAGKSLGLDPMNALANIFVVHGRPALYARTMVALVLAQGHEVVRTHADDTAVTVAARRKGSEDWQEFTWTIARAQKAGYTGNKKYQTDPIAMLTAKAQAEACRTIAPDVLTGMAHSVEEVELEDMGERKPRAGAPKPSGSVAALAAAAKAAPAPTQDPEPEIVDVETGEVADPEPASEPASHAQIDTLVQLLGEAGFTTKAQKQNAIAERLGARKSATELTAEEATTLSMYFADLADATDDAAATTA